MFAKNKRDEDIKFLKEVYGANFEAQSHKKLWNYFLAMAKTKDFQDKISVLRVKYKIPENGFENGRAYFVAPEVWRKDYDYKGAENLLGEIWEELKPICEKYKLYVPDWQEVMGYYLFYNEFQPMYGDNSYNLCMVGDLLGEKRARNRERKSTKTKPLNITETDLFFPIAIRISPYASERDLIDYVKKMFPLIKDFQKPYLNPKVKIGKVKRKNPSIEARNDFIYDNKHLSLNETKAQVEAKFAEVLDYEYIGKIRSEEAKKRQEV